MAKQIRVTVKAKHIRLGKAGAIKACPMALALKEQYECIGDEFISVGFERATVKDTRYALSKTAARFVNRFDTGKPVKPATFVLTELYRV